MGKDYRCGRQQDEQEKSKVKNPRCKTGTWDTRLPFRMRPVSNGAFAPSAISNSFGTVGVNEHIRHSFAGEDY
jgi:hypothetical protein